VIEHDSDGGVDGRGSEHLAPGFMLAEYRIEALLGQGGFGITYLATDTLLQAPVAIKEYLPGEIAGRRTSGQVAPCAEHDAARYLAGRERFLEEARTLASFRHPNIVRVTRFFEANGSAYMVLEYERGSSLRQWFATRPRVTEGDLSALLQPLLDGISRVHEGGFLHLDIKPDNIQVRAAGDGLVLLDFGSARQATADIGQASISLTPGYAAPEQYGGRKHGPWTDVYSLGATLYWMVAGLAPPPANSRPADADPCVPAARLGQGRFKHSILDANDWANHPHPARRPRTVDDWTAALFAAHASRFSLPAALKLSDSPRLRGRLSRLVVAANPSSWPLALKLAAGVMLTALLPILLTALQGLAFSVEALSQSELRNLEALARSTAGRVSQLVTDCENLARTVSADDGFAAVLQRPTEPAQRRIQARLEALANANPDVDLLLLLDKTGHVLASSNATVTGRNLAFREYFQDAAAGRVHAASFIVGSVTGTPGVVYAHPVLDAHGTVVGVVALRVKAASVETAMTGATSGSNRTPFLVDGDGVLVSHPDARLLYRSLGPLSTATQDAIRRDRRFAGHEVTSLGHSALARAMTGARSPGHVTYRSPLTGEDEIAGFAPVAGHDWVVGVSDPRRSFEEPVRRLMLHLVAISVAAGIVCLLFAVLFARGILLPVRALARAAEALKAGDFSAAAVPVRSSDEMGRLARTFNVMVDVLRDRELRKPRGPAP
jgi:serine/threonine protein kinase/HAMP domain-containing protein